MVVRLLILSASLLLVSAYLTSASEAETAISRQSLSEVPVQIEDWHARDAAPLDNRVVAVLGVDDFLNRIYSSNEASVGVYIGFYKSQREGSAIHSPMNCLPGAGWNPVDRTLLRVRVNEGNGRSQPRDIEINRITIAKGAEKQVVLYWYQSHGRVIASEYWGKIYTVLDTLQMNRTDGALVRVISPVLGSNSNAESAAADAAVNFVQSIFPMLSRYLPA